MLENGKQTLDGENGKNIVVDILVNQTVGD